MPVASIAGEARHVEIQDGADLAGTQPCDQTLEARTSHLSACRPPEIIVDHLNLLKAASPSEIDQLVLPARALGVRLHLRLDGLADGDHSDEQMMQIRQSRDRHSRPTHLHGGAGSSIEHPCRHDRDDARSDLDMKDLTARPLLTVVPL